MEERERRHTIRGMPFLKRMMMGMSCGGRSACAVDEHGPRDPITIGDLMFFAYSYVPAHRTDLDFDLRGDFFFFFSIFSIFFSLF